MLQPVVVLTGIVSLGRIYNVVGAIVDPFLDNRLSAGYQQCTTNQSTKSISSMNSVVVGQVNRDSMNKIVAEEIDAWTGNTRSRSIVGIDTRINDIGRRVGYMQHSSTSINWEVIDRSHAYLYDHVTYNWMCIYHE